MNYRIVCLIGIISFLMPMASQADEPAKASRRLLAGAHVGVDFATIGGSELDDPGVDYSHRSGFTGGGMVAFRVTRHISIQAELDIATKGFRADTGFPSTSGTQYEAYVEFPLLVQLSLPLSERFQLHAYVGTALGILLDTDIRFDDGQFDESERGRERLDIGAMLGAGTAVAISDLGQLTIDARYNFGMRNRNENPAVSESFNRAIYLTVGYRADLATLGRLFGRGSRPAPAEPAGGPPATAPEPTTTGARR